jgi:hypothetical protein
VYAQEADGFSLTQGRPALIPREQLNLGIAR